MLQKLHIDIETFSSIDIKKAGIYKYVQAPDFEIILLAYAFGQGGIKIVDLANGEALPLEFLEALINKEVIKCAHNATFERLCFNAIGLHTPIEVWECSMVKAAYCGLPLSLDQVSTALQLEEKGKLSTGRALIKYFCTPCPPTASNGGRFRNLPKDAPEKWEEMRDYIYNDVEAEREVFRILAPYKIPDFERSNYLLDQKINDRGVLIDLELAKNATGIDTMHRKKLITKAKELTGLDNPNSPGQLKDWLSLNAGKEINTLAKETLNSLILETGPGPVLEVLKLRRALSKSSTAKYTAMLEVAGDDNRARGLFQFYGASRTGRWAGRLIQLQNLPQNKIKELAEARAMVAANNYPLMDLYYSNVSGILSQLIRTALIPSPGYTFAVADFSAIEARVIAWFAGEKWRLDVFNTHGKIYEASAALMFNVDITEVTKGSDLRAKGKVAELALGYQGGVNALRTMGAERMGLTVLEMETIVTKWRLANAKITAFWHSVDQKVKQAIKTGKPTETSDKKLKFIYSNGALEIVLPSGRSLIYYGASLGVNRFGSESITYMGMNQTTRQWGHQETYGGKLVENIVQATARDLLAFSMQSLDKTGFDIVMHVHDEIIVETPEQGSLENLKKMCALMGQAPDWAEGLPLNADGYLTEFYKKD